MPINKSAMAFPKKPKRKKSKPLMSEAEIQQEVEDILNNYDIKFIHLSESVYNKKRVGSKYKGVPDLLIFIPFGDYNHSMLLELKREDGHISQGQITWHKGVNVQVTWSLKEAKEELEKFIQKTNELVGEES